MSPDRLAKLRAAIRERGFLAPLLVRPRAADQPGEGNSPGRFEVIDGEHRLAIARELGLDALPCVVAELDDAAAKIKTLQLNGLRGENDPGRLARVLAELAVELGTAELARGLPWSDFEIEQMIALVNREAEQTLKKAAAGLPPRPAVQELFAVVVSADQLALIEAAIAAAQAREALPDSAAALARICQAYLEPAAPAPEKDPGAPAPTPAP